MFEINFAMAEDLNQLKSLDAHLSDEHLAEKVWKKEVMVLRAEGNIIASLRFGLFWDQIPFMNLLMVVEPWRRQGIGRKLVTAWENEMINQKYNLVVTSTQSNEDAQHFYRKLGYADIGGFALPLEPLEMILMKPIGMNALNTKPTINPSN